MYNNPMQKLSLLTEDQRKRAIQDIQSFFATERDEEIGLIAAEDILETFLNSVGKTVYNMGVKETLTFIKERNSGTALDAEVTLLKD